MIIGTGVDITEVSRLRKAAEKWGEIFLTRVFTDKELSNAKTKESSLYQHLAGRFAAKEAVFKAMGNPRLNLKDIEILNDPEGKPFCNILDESIKNTAIYISISHVKSYAVANAIITSQGERP